MISANVLIALIEDAHREQDDVAIITAAEEIYLSFRHGEVTLTVRSPSSVVSRGDNIRIYQNGPMLLYIEVLRNGDSVVSLELYLRRVRKAALVRDGMVIGDVQGWEVDA